MVWIWFLHDALPYRFALRCARGLHHFPLPGLQVASNARRMYTLVAQAWTCASLFRYHCFCSLFFFFVLGSAGMHDIRVRFEYGMTKYGSGAPFGITPCHLHITLHIIISMEYSVISNASSCPALLSTLCVLTCWAGWSVGQRTTLPTYGDSLFSYFDSVYLFWRKKEGQCPLSAPLNTTKVYPGRSRSRRWRCRSRTLEKPPKVQKYVQYTIYDVYNAVYYGQSGHYRCCSACVLVRSHQSIFCLCI